MEDWRPHSGWYWRVGRWISASSLGLASKVLPVFTQFWPALSYLAAVASTPKRPWMRDWGISQDELITINSVASSAAALVVLLPWLSWCNLTPATAMDGRDTPLNRKNVMREPQWLPLVPKAWQLSSPQLIWWASWEWYRCWLPKHTPSRKSIRRNPTGPCQNWVRVRRNWNNLTGELHLGELIMLAPGRTKPRPHWQLSTWKIGLREGHVQHTQSDFDWSLRMLRTFREWGIGTRCSWNSAAMAMITLGSLDRTHQSCSCGLTRRTATPDQCCDAPGTMTLRHWLLSKEVPTFPLPGIFFFDAWRIRPQLQVPLTLSVGLTAVDLTPPRWTVCYSVKRWSQCKNKCGKCGGSGACGPTHPVQAIDLANSARLHYLEVQKEHEEEIGQRGGSKRRATGSTRQSIPAPAAPPAIHTLSHEGSPILPRAIFDKVLSNLRHLPENWPLMRFDLMLHKSASYYAIWRRFLRLNEYLRTFSEQAANATIDAHARGLTEHLVQFLAEWIILALEPARAVTKVRAPDFLFLPEKDFWFKQIWVDLRQTMVLDRQGSYSRPVIGLVTGTQTARILGVQGMLAWMGW